MKSIKKNNLSLFLTFLKIGTFTFGGGYAMISLIQKEIVEKRQWVSDEDISNIITISETTPGPISINVSTYVGYKIGGNLGALCATLGAICSPFFVIILLSTILQNFQNNNIFQNAFWGIRAGVIALIIKVLLNMYKKCPKNLYSYIAILISLIMILVFHINSIYVIIGCIIVRLIVFYITNRKERA